MVRTKVVFKPYPQVGTISNDIFKNSSERKTEQPEQKDNRSPHTCMNLTCLTQHKWSGIHIFRFSMNVGLHSFATK